MESAEGERAVYFEDSSAPKGAADADLVALGDFLEGVEIFGVLSWGIGEELAVGVEAAGIEGHFGRSGLNIVSHV